MSELIKYLKTLNQHSVFGVYIFTNIQNNRQYVGSTRNIKQRIKNYFEPARLKRGSLRGSLICRSILKHKVDNFTVTLILPEMENTSINFTSDMYTLLVILNEQWFLNHYSFEYNIQRSVTAGPIQPYNRNISLFIYKHFELVG